MCLALTVLEVFMLCVRHVGCDISAKEGKPAEVELRGEGSEGGWVGTIM